LTTNLKLPSTARAATYVARRATLLTNRERPPFLGYLPDYHKVSTAHTKVLCPIRRFVTTNTATRACAA